MPQQTPTHWLQRPEWADATTIRYGSLLFLLVLSFLVSGFSSNLADHAVWAINIFVVLAAFKLTRITRTRTQMLILTALAIMAFALGAFTSVRDEWRGVAYLAQFFLLGFIAFSLIVSILGRPYVDRQTLLGVSAAYLLIGLMFSWLYLAIDVWDDAQINLDPADTADYPEFSFIVQTTVGFGNQIPTANMAARFVVIQAVTAQLFLATFVARMVAMYGRPRAETSEST